MKTKKQVIADNSDFKSLINAVINQLGGIDSVQDINSHGINGGFSGFIYYSETHAFALKNRKQITELLEQQADQLDEEVGDMVANFGVFRQRKMDYEDKKHLYSYLDGGSPEQGTVTNVLAWFAAEEVCRMFEN